MKVGQPEQLKLRFAIYGGKDLCVAFREKLINKSRKNLDTIPEADLP